MTFAEKLKSLRKQASMSQEQLAEKLGVSRQAVTKWETDTGIPLGSSSALTSILTELGTNRHILFETQVIRPCGNTGGQDTYSLKQKRTRGTDYRKPCSRMTSCTAPAIRTSVFIHELNPRKI